MKKSEVLEKAKSLIDKPENWHQGFFYDEENNNTNCMCSLGAVVRAIDETVASPNMLGPIELSMYHEIHRGFNVILKRSHARKRDMAIWNDDDATTHDDVMKMFDAAISIQKFSEYVERPVE